MRNLTIRVVLLGLFAATTTVVAICAPEPIVDIAVIQEFEDRHWAEMTDDAKVEYVLGLQKQIQPVLESSGPFTPRTQQLYLQFLVVVEKLFKGNDSFSFSLLKKVLTDQEFADAAAIVTGELNKIRQLQIEIKESEKRLETRLRANEQMRSEIEEMEKRAAVRHRMSELMKAKLDEIE
jgi:hypothetical protein